MAFSFGKKYENPLDINVYTDVNGYTSTCSCGQDDYVFRFANKPTKDLTTYTTGKSFRWHGYDLDLMLVSSSVSKEVHLSATLRLLIEYFMDDCPDDFKPGGVTKNLGSLNENSPELVAFYIMHSNVFNNKLVDAEFMQIMPVSVKERKYIEIYGGEALERYFIDNKVDTTDVTRGCSMPELHLSYSDIPDLNEKSTRNDCFIYDHEEYGEIVIELSSDRPFDGVTTYICDDFTTVNPVKFHKNAMMSSSNDDMVTLFIPACEFFWKNPDFFKEGHATPSQGPVMEGSVLTAIYVSHLHWFSIPKLNSSYLMLTPISDTELSYLEEHGSIKFEELLFGSGLDLFDFNRRSSV